MNKYLLVMSGGAIGSLMRFLMSSAITFRYNGRFPLGTFAVNVAGSFAMGVVAVLVQRHLHDNWRLFLGVGFLGGYTTFSAFEYEIYLSTKDSGFALAGFYAAASVVCGFLALLAGVALGRRWA